MHMDNSLVQVTMICWMNRLSRCLSSFHLCLFDTLSKKISFVSNSPMSILWLNESKKEGKHKMLPEKKKLLLLWIELYWMRWESLYITSFHSFQSHLVCSTYAKNISILHVCMLYLSVDPSFLIPLFAELNSFSFVS